jgi:hypothetical protein
VADALGLLGLIVYITCVISLAAAITWVVVRFSPAKSSNNAGS